MTTPNGHPLSGPTPPFVRAMLAAARRRAALTLEEGSPWQTEVVVACMLLEQKITQEQLDAFTDRMAQNGLNFDNAIQDAAIYEFLVQQIKLAANAA